MGRCQGGFCATNCLELLSSELGIKLSRDHQTLPPGHGWSSTAPTAPPQGRVMID